MNMNCNRSLPLTDYDYYITEIDGFEVRFNPKRNAFSVSRENLVSYETSTSTEGVSWWLFKAGTNQFHIVKIYHKKVGDEIKAIIELFKYKSLSYILGGTSLMSGTEDTVVECKIKIVKQSRSIEDLKKQLKNSLEKGLRPSDVLLKEAITKMPEGDDEFKELVFKVWRMTMEQITGIDVKEE